MSAVLLIALQIHIAGPWHTIREENTVFWELNPTQKPWLTMIFGWWHLENMKAYIASSGYGAMEVHTHLAFLSTYFRSDKRLQDDQYKETLSSDGSFVQSERSSLQEMARIPTTQISISLLFLTPAVPYTAGNPLPKDVVEGGSMNSLGAIYCMRAWHMYEGQPAQAFGYYAPSTGLGYYAWFGSKETSQMEILVEAHLCYWITKTYELLCFSDSVHRLENNVRL